MTTAHKGRTPYYSEAMTRLNMRIPGALWQRVRDKAQELSRTAGRKISAADLTRKALERLLKDI
jgi:hypothetical protein